eukprot:202808-Karenia_brevis.AAC.1
MRMKLFNATVTPCFLYGSGTWTITASCEHTISTAQRKMLRWMLGSGRKMVEQADAMARSGDLS